MNRYEELGIRLDKILEQRRRISTSRYGMIPAEGHQREWEWLTQQISQIREEMRRARYRE